jgi:hypothetical protein
VNASSNDKQQELVIATTSGFNHFPSSNRQAIPSLIETLSAESFSGTDFIKERGIYVGNARGPTAMWAHQQKHFLSF